ncbi:MAG: hypothetical protein Q9176_008065 [Flavoplaca citrina]
MVQFIAGLDFSYNVKEDCAEPLDTWVGRNKELLRTVDLVEILLTPENGMETSEWALRKIIRAPSQLGLPLVLPGTALRLPSKESATFPSQSMPMVRVFFSWTPPTTSAHK